MAKEAPSPPSPQAWLRDFKDMLALPKVTADAAKQLIYERYPDGGWADEWGFSLWCAWCYLRRHQAEWEEEYLVVLGTRQAIMKDGLMLALYEPFLRCPMDKMLTVDFPVKEITEKAHELEKKFPAKP
jgi:hypothetical protein